MLWVVKTIDFSPQGDTPANSIWAETLDRQHNVTRWLAEKIAEYMPGTPAFPTIGNHGML